MIENDDRTYSISDVATLSERTGIKVVWDALHYRCNDPDGISESEALDLAFGTWPEGVVPKIHYSSPRVNIEERKRKVGRRVIREPVLSSSRNGGGPGFGAAYALQMAEPTTERTIDERVGAAREGLTLLADYL